MGSGRSFFGDVALDAVSKVREGFNVDQILMAEGLSILALLDALAWLLGPYQDFRTGSTSLAKSVRPRSATW